MKTVKFYPDAEDEMIAAAQYYESQQSQLGRRFLTSVQDAINRIVINPRLYQTIDLDVRRCLTKVFPFGILFRELPDKVIIMAVGGLTKESNKGILPA